MKINNPNPQGVSEQVILNNLYRLFGERVFKEMQNRDESIPAEEFFNNLMDTSLEFCVRISDSINRIEKASKSANVAPAQPDAVQPKPKAPSEPAVKPAPAAVAAPAQAVQGKKCPKCNAVCDDDSLFCTECGFKWPAVQPAPVVPPSPPAGELKPLFCSNCGTKLDGDSIFCVNCGQRLDD